MNLIQFISGTIIFFMINSSIVGQEKLVDKVVAKVGSEYILLSEIEEEFSYEKSKNPSLSDDIKCVILDNVIAQKLVVYHAKIDSVEIQSKKTSPSDESADSGSSSIPVSGDELPTATTTEE